jgi:hypothetical protein
MLTGLGERVHFANSRTLTFGTVTCRTSFWPGTATEEWSLRALPSVRPTGCSSSSIWTPSCRAMASPCRTSLPKRLVPSAVAQIDDSVRIHGDGWRFPRSPVDSDGVPNPRATDHPCQAITKPIRLASLRRLCYRT